MMLSPVSLSAAIPRGPRARIRLQIITASENGDAFTLHGKKVKQILKQIPANRKVCVISVVGAFRVGKSFLLDMFLRYLTYYEENPTGAFFLSCCTAHRSLAVPGHGSQAWGDSYRPLCP